MFYYATTAIFEYDNAHWLYSCRNKKEGFALTPPRLINKQTGELSCISHGKYAKAIQSKNLI